MLYERWKTILIVARIAVEVERTEQPSSPTIREWTDLPLAAYRSSQQTALRCFGQKPRY